MKAIFKPVLTVTALAMLRLASHSTSAVAQVKDPADAMSQRGEEQKTLLETLPEKTAPVMGSAKDMSVGEKLKRRKKDFAAKAPAAKVADYEEGVRLVAESGVLERAKNVGDMAPDFILPNAVGADVALAELLEQGPVVLVWYRGEWCPYCNIYLEDLQAHADDFKDAGASVVAVSPETPDHGWSVQDRLDIKFHVLSDAQSKIADEYGITYTLPPKIAGYLQDAFDIHDANQDERNILPLAASYVIDQDGTITYAFIDPDYRKRAETSVLLDEVKKLQE